MRPDAQGFRSEPPQVRPLTAIAGACAALSTSAAGAAGLWEHYQSALQENPDYLEQVAAAERAQEQPLVRRAFLLPHVAATDRRTRQSPLEMTGGGGPPDRRVRAQSLSLRQTLFDLPNWLQYKAAFDLRDAAQLRAQAARSVLMIEVAEAYFDALWTGQLRQLAAARRRAVRRQLDSIESGVAAGAATVLDQLRGQAELQAILAEEIAARGDHELALRSLAFLAGIEDESLEPVGPHVPAEAGEPRESLRERARANNLTIRALRKDRAEAEAAVEIARSKALPTVGFSVARTRSDGDRSEREYDTRASIELQWTLFAGGGNRPVRRQALADRRAADIRLRGGIQAAESRTDQALNRIRNGESRVKALEASVEAGQELLDIVAFGYRENVNVLADVFDAQKDLADAQSRRARARYDLLLNSLRLLDAVGALDDGRFRSFTQAIAE